MEGRGWGLQPTIATAVAGRPGLRRHGQYGRMEKVSRSFFLGLCFTYEAKKGSYEGGFGKKKRRLAGPCSVLGAHIAGNTADFVSSVL